MPRRPDRVPKAPRRSRASPPPRPRQAPGQGPIHLFDRRFAATAAALTVALLATAWYYVERTGPTGWSLPLLVLCVLLAAAVGRALLGPGSVGDDQEATRPARLTPLIWPVLLAAAFLPNLPALRVGFLADDFGLLRAAQLAAGPLDVARMLPLKIFYRPVSLLVWWLGLHLWNGAPLGYHLVGLLLHTANTSLLYLLARRYTGSAYGGLMAALLFALHPFHLEPTLWPAAQPDLLCTAFCLSSLWCVDCHLAAAGRLRSALAFAGALLAFLLALWSKETAAALPALILLRFALVPRDQRRARALPIVAAYAPALVAYFVVRHLMLAEHWLGDYRTQLAWWHLLFPSTPLLLTGQLFFPVHRDLLTSLFPPYLLAAAIALMALALLWWIRSLELVSWRRLVLYAGYLFMPVLPVWTAGLTLGADMENTRYGYLPSVGLALLFGHICARQRGPSRRSVLAGVLMILFAAALSAWYVAPWKQAARLRDEVLAAGVQLVTQLPDSPPPTTVFFQSVPSSHLGAPMFVEGCYAKALSPLLPRPLPVEDIPSTPEALDLMSASDLLPGEYLVSWDAESQTMVIERSGAAPAPAAEARGQP